MNAVHTFDNPLNHASRRRDRTSLGRVPLARTGGRSVLPGHGKGLCCQGRGRSVLPGHSNALCCQDIGKGPCCQVMGKVRAVRTSARVRVARTWEGSVLPGHWQRSRRQDIGDIPDRWVLIPCELVSHWSCLYFETTASDHYCKLHPPYPDYRVWRQRSPARPSGWPAEHADHCGDGGGGVGAGPAEHLHSQGEPRPRWRHITCEGAADTERTG